MRKFFQKKPKADFYLTAKNTLVVRNDAIEYIFPSGHEWYSVINLTITEKAVILMACLGDLVTQMDKVFEEIDNDPDDTPTFLDLVDGRSKYVLTQLSHDGSDMITGITKTIYRKPKPWLQVIGEEGIHKEIVKLNDFCYKVYNELHGSKTPQMQSLCHFFVD